MTSLSDSNLPGYFHSWGRQSRLMLKSPGTSRRRLQYLTSQKHWGPQALWVPPGSDQNFSEQKQHGDRGVIICQVAEVRTHTQEPTETQANGSVWLNTFYHAKPWEHIIVTQSRAHMCRTHSRTTMGRPSLLQLPVWPLWRKHRNSPQRNPRLLFVVFGTSGSSTAATLTEANKPCYLGWHPERPVHVAREPGRKRPARAAVTLWLVINWKIKQEERDVSHGFEALCVGELWLQSSNI